MNAPKMVCEHCGQPVGWHPQMELLLVHVGTGLMACGAFYASRARLARVSR